MNIKERIKILSFFTGGGFMDLGFEQAGFETVWTNEVNPLFAEMYKAGMNSWRVHQGKAEIDGISDPRSLIDISSEEIVQFSFGNEKPRIFGIIGGPPCQDFSFAGNRQGFDGDRGKLTGVYYEKVSEIKPTFFVMENVEGLWKIKKNKARLLGILKEINDDYVIIHKVLNAINYGVPQDRKRLFIVGFSKNHIENPEFSVYNYFKWPLEIYKDALTKYNWPLRHPYQGRRRKQKALPDELCIQSCLVNENSRKVANANEVFNAYSTKFHTIEEGDTRNQSFKRLHRHRYSPTACYGNNEVHLHPFLPRRLSVREVLRIQGVPDEYVLPSIIGPEKRHTGLSAKFKMIGNGVPVPLARHVGKSILQFLYDSILRSNGHLVEGKKKPSNVKNPA